MDVDDYLFKAILWWSLKSAIQIFLQGNFLMDMFNHLISEFSIIWKHLVFSLHMNLSESIQ